MPCGCVSSATQQNVLANVVLPATSPCLIGADPKQVRAFVTDRLSALSFASCSSCRRGVPIASPQRRSMRPPSANVGPLPNRSFGRCAFTR